jgi:hypothetical protein
VASADRRRERQVRQLLDQARREAQSGQAGDALRFQGEAIELSRALAGQYPADPRHRLSVASALYSQASMLTRAGRPADAVQALDESEQLYRSLGGTPGMPDIPPLVADISARRALALAGDGRGASAVPEAAAAVAFYEEMAGTDPARSRQRDLARVCADNAEVLARFGDPDIAAASADRAVRLYLSGAPPGTLCVSREDVGYLVTAASVGATIHAWHGRIEVSLAAAQLALKFASPGPLQETLRAVAARVDGLPPAGRASFGQDVAAALRRPPGAPSAAPAGPVAHAGPDAHAGPVTPAEPATPSEPATPTAPAAPTTVASSGDDAEAAAHVIGMLRAVAAVRMPAPSAGSAELITLTQALGRVGQVELGTGITRPALDGAIITPAGRCSPQMAPSYARRLAELAVAVLPAAPADGIRIGLEAHYLYAAASSRRVTAMRYQFAEFGPAWARVLLACSAEFERHGDLRMALDLASWAAGAAQQLAPLAALDFQVLVPLVRQCVERHGRMLMATGDRDEGEAALAAARTIGRPAARRG